MSLADRQAISPFHHLLILSSPAPDPYIQMTMADFEYNASPCRVIFGIGTISQVPKELTRLGLSKPLILSTAGQKRLANQLCDVVGESVAGVFSEVVMHTPTEV